MQKDAKDVLEALKLKLSTPLSASSIFEEVPRLEGRIRPYHPTRSAAIVAGLLTEPAFQANNQRLETLVHLLLSAARGKRTPTAKQIATWLNEDLATSQCIYLEDPPEDVFVSNIISWEGNHRIFEGRWECSDFHLQRVINVIETLPDSPESAALRREVIATLRISEEMARRRTLKRFSPSGGEEKTLMSVPSPKRLLSLRRSIEFSQADLDRLGIAPDDLAPFVLANAHMHDLRDQPIQDSALQRRPIVEMEHKYFVLLPAAISVAVRHRVFEWMLERGYQDSFDRHMASEYVSVLQDTLILGRFISAADLFGLHEVDCWHLFEFVGEFDAGRYIHVMALVESVTEYARLGLVQPKRDNPILFAHIEQRVNDTYSLHKSLANFRQGLTLLVGCGYGRPLGFSAKSPALDWDVDFVSAPDLQTLGRASCQDDLSLWKLLEYEKHLRKCGVTLVNINGLLNLYGWWVGTGYWMIPPGVDIDDREIMVGIPTDCLMEARQRVRLEWDVHSLPLADGRRAVVQRLTAGAKLDSEKRESLYYSLSPVCCGGDALAWVGDALIWWLTVDAKHSTLPRNIVRQILNAVHQWMDRVCPMLEGTLDSLCVMCPIVVLDMNGIIDDKSKMTDEGDLKSCVSVSVNCDEAVIRISIRDPFIDAFSDVENIAERALVRAFVQGAYELANKPLSRRELGEIIGDVFVNMHARNFHVREAREFPEYIQSYDRPISLFTEEADLCLAKLGLGWISHGDNAKTRFDNPSDCCRFLNLVVEKLCNRMRVQLRRFNRLSLIEKALRHLEGVRVEEHRWLTTLKAMCALNPEEDTPYELTRAQTVRFNTSSVGLRMIVEMALSESRLSGGLQVGRLDILPLLADAELVFFFAGCSDAISKCVMKPQVDVTPNGDIAVDETFHRAIALNLAKESETSRLDTAVDAYERTYQPFKPVPDVEEHFSPDFRDAFRAEFGVSIQKLRMVRDALEDMAISLETCVLVAREREIVEFCRGDVGSSLVTRKVLRRFSLWPKRSWESTPEGYQARDWCLWRFGRRLSLVARALVRLESCSNPRYVVSPGILGDSVYWNIRRYHQAVVDPSTCSSLEMKGWVDSETNRRGHRFAREVCDFLGRAGYFTRCEERLDALLGEKLGKDYGDVDVLAWKSDSREILAIECKSLRLAMTANDMAEQLNRFSGQETRKGKRDELLKHIDRCELLQKKAVRLAKVLGLNVPDVLIRAVVCFSDPVPMKYVSKRFPNVDFTTFEELKARVAVD